MKEPVAISGDLATIEAARVQWVEMATPEERAKLREVLGAHDTKTIPGLNAMVGDIVVLILVGDVSPSLAVAARPFIEFMAANVWAMHARNDTEEQVSTDVVRIVAEIKQRVGELKPTYQLAAAEPDEDVVEAVKVPVKAAG